MKCISFTSAIGGLLLLVSLAVGQDSANPKTVSPKAIASQVPTLKSQLDEVSAQAAKMLPPDLMTKVKDGIEAVRAAGVETMAKQVGDSAPDATLTNFNGQSVQLSALWKQGPVVLMWYRGGW